MIEIRGIPMLQLADAPISFGASLLLGFLCGWVFNVWAISRKEQSGVSPKNVAFKNKAPGDLDLASPLSEGDSAYPLDESGTGSRDSSPLKSAGRRLRAPSTNFHPPPGGAMVSLNAPYFGTVDSR